MRIVGFVGVLILSGCAESPTSVSQVEEGENLTWYCYDPIDPHCSNTPPVGDPDTSAAGVFLGDFNPTFCYSPSSDDDSDGVDDFCEYQLARSFRPYLSTNPYVMI